MDNTLYDFWPITDRPMIEWPNGAKVAFWLGLNIEHYEVDKPSTSIFPGTAGLAPDPLNYGWRDYGPRVGLWRMADVMAKHGVRGSVLLNSDVCVRFPQIIELGNARDWVWLAHGKNNSIFQAGFTEDEEREYLCQVVDTLVAGTDHSPKGWLGPALTETYNTPKLLAELGLTYVCDWCSDDQPFPLKVPGARMISVPYSIEVNDIPLFVGKSMSGDDFYRLVMDQLETLVESASPSGLVMSLAVHPFVTGQPFRLKYLDKILGEIAAARNVWLTTSDEIADFYLEKYYDLAAASIYARREQGIET
ncbi:MAG: polysaccharide deacetylase [Actinomycetota bacterium]|nr:MAG: polysaccharide deacetylase [Actinomycetota bacterium]